MKTLVFHSIFFALLGLILSPLAATHASPPPADSTHFCQLFDFEQWERDHVRPAAKRLAGAQESGDQPDPPFAGTVWIDPDIITPSDPTAFQDITAAGRGERTMLDRRVNDWITVNAYLFDARFDDGLTAEIQVNPEFGRVSAAMEEANKYGRAIGQLPTVLRTNVETVWIHKGDHPWGGGNNNILIYVGGMSDWRKEFLEEILVHEAAHTSLDPGWQGIVDADDWSAAQMADGNFISDYARDHPEREDIAESFLPYLAVRYRSARISPHYEQTVLETMPNRIAYFDRLLQVSASNDMYPITEDLADEQPFERPPELVACSQSLYELDGNSGDQWVNLKPYNPNQLSRLLPITSGKETEIIFVNNSTIEVLFYWLDYDLSEKYFGRVAACNSRTQGTFAGHIWIVKDQHGKNLAMFQAEAKTGRAFIGSQTPPDTVDDEQPESASAQLTKVSGDNQQGLASAQLARPFVVSVLDQDGSPLAGAVVSFSVTAGGGTLSSTTATTDANGRARTTLTLGSDPGPNTVAATVEGLGTATFTATASEPASDSQEDPEPDPQLESLSVTIDDVTSAAERGRMTFTVRLEPTPTASTTVKYATTSQTARAGEDYEAVSGTLEFEAGQSTATFTVRIRPDEQDEPDETFAVRIVHPSTGARLAEATGTITDDDGASPPEADSDGDDERADGEGAFAFGGEVEDQAYTAGTAISALVLPEAVGGEGEITYHLSALPAGLTFDAATRMISGTPEAASDGAVEITYTAQDSTGATATLTFSITVNPALSFGDFFDLFN